MQRLNKNSLYLGQKNVHIFVPGNYINCVLTSEQFLKEDCEFLGCPGSNFLLPHYVQCEGKSKKKTLPV